jgi:hypothetical protein
LELIFIVDRLDLEGVVSTVVMVCSLFAKGLQVGLKLDSVVVVVVVKSFDTTVSGEAGVDDGDSFVIDFVIVVFDVVVVDFVVVVDVDVVVVDFVVVVEVDVDVVVVV